MFHMLMCLLCFRELYGFRSLWGECCSCLPFNADFSTVLSQTFFGLLSLSFCCALRGGGAGNTWSAHILGEFRVGALFLPFSFLPFLPSQPVIAQGTVVTAFILPAGYICLF